MTAERGADGSVARMRAAMLAAPGRIEVVSIPVPAPAPGQLLVEVEANAICGSDLKAYLGHYPRGTTPTVLGHELVGKVVEQPEADDRPLVGTRVCVEPNLRCGVCELCSQGLTNLCPDYHLLGESLEYQGACAEYVVVEQAYAHVLPPQLSPLAGALVQPFAISYEGVVQRGRVAAGEKVLVVGGGPIGLGAMLLARLQGAEVMVSDVAPHRLDKARELGAEQVVRPDREDLAAAVAAFTDGRGVDLSVEAVGGKQTASLRDAQRSTASRGRIVALGTFTDPEMPFPVNALKNREQMLIGSLGHPDTFAPVIELMAAGVLQPEALVSHRIGLDELGKMFELLDARADGVVKVVVEPSRDVASSGHDERNGDVLHPL